MGLSLRELEEKRARIARLAQRRAFESYVRYGRVPQVYADLIDIAGDEKKFLAFCRSDLSRKALGDTRPTTHYIWRTARDERVRSAHAANEGRIFSWSDQPVTGHPGQAPNCRCWAEPYYGNPAAPDTPLPLRRDLRTDASGGEPWTSIETLTRLDGSLAETTILGRDGTRFHSTFSGGRVAHEVTLPDGQVVTVETRDGVQTIYSGDSRTPVLESVWTASGPQVSVPRTRGAIVGALAPLGRVVLQEILKSPAVPAALLALYNMLNAEPASLGAGAADVPIMAFEAWDYDGSRDSAPVMTGTLTQEQVAQICKRYPEVQAWTDEAARLNGPQRWLLGPQRFGVAVHQWIKRRIEALKAAGGYDDLHAEYSIVLGSEAPISYGALGSTRLDVLKRTEDGTVCAYDIKTGKAGLSSGRRQQIGSHVYYRFGPVRYIIIEVRALE